MPDISEDPAARLQVFLDKVCASSLSPGAGGVGDRVEALAAAQAAGFGGSYVVCELHATRAMPLTAFIFGHYLGSERENLRINGHDAAHVHSAGSARLAYDGESYPAQIAAREARRRQVSS